MFVEFLRAPDCPHVSLPEYRSAGASGFDLAAAEAFSIFPGERRLVRTGLVLAFMAAGFEIQIRPRSGLALKHGVTVLNAPGTVDGDWRGEIQVLLISHGESVHTVAVGDRIAQAIVAPVMRSQILWGTHVQATARGANGFGSTG